MNQEYKEKLSGKIEKNFSDLEMRIMEDIVRRIKKTGEITSTADWQINRLLIFGASSEDIERMLKEVLDASYPEMFELYDKVIDWEYVRNKDIYEQINQRFIPYEENTMLQQLTEGYIRQTKEDLENITQSLGFCLDYGNGRKVITPLAQIYQGYLDAAMLDITSGAFDYGSVLRRVVKQLTNSGLRTIDYASGHSNRVNVAARRAVMTGITQLSGQIADMNAEELGTDYFEIDWHAGARPTHQVWQGRVYSKEELVSVCGLGSVTGLEGANCYHGRHPFFPGISVRNWSDEWLDAKNKEENTPKKFRGKEYTVYEAKQKQRQMETAMRAQRQKVKLLQSGGADPDEVMLARCKYQGQLNEYGVFSKKMGLKQERERIYLDLQGRVAPGKVSVSAKKSIASDVKTGIIKTSKTKEDNNVLEFKALGEIDTTFLEMEFGKIRTKEIIVTNERLLHIRQRHPQDYELFEKYGENSVQNPDYIIKDTKNAGTVFMVKRLPDTNLNVVVRVVLDTDKEGLKNSVMTFYRIRERNLKKLIEKNVMLYKKE